MTPVASSRTGIASESISSSRSSEPIRSASSSSPLSDTSRARSKLRRAFSIDARGLGWAKGVGTFATKELLDLNYKQPPWSVKYPELRGILEDEPLAPKGNVMARNICWGGPWGWTQPEALPLVKFQDNLVDVDPRFVGKAPADFRLAEDSPAYKLGFQPIPLVEIGVYQSEDRASWPVEHALRR